MLPTIPSGDTNYHFLVPSPPAPTISPKSIKESKLQHRTMTLHVQPAMIVRDSFQTRRGRKASYNRARDTQLQRAHAVRWGTENPGHLRRNSCNRRCSGVHRARAPSLIHFHYISAIIRSRTVESSLPAFRTDTARSSAFFLFHQTLGVKKNIEDTYTCFVIFF